MAASQCARASPSLQDKTAQKQYLALVDGDLDWSKIPFRSRAEIDKLDTESKKKRKRQAGGGLQYKNASSFYQETQQVLKRRQASGEVLSQEEAVLVQAKWKEVKRSSDACQKSLFERCEALAEADKARVLAEAQQGAEQAGENPASGLGLGVWRWESDGDAVEEVLVDAPIAEIPGDFKMKIGTREHPGRAARTTARLLERGTFRGKPCCLVQLTPHTGRRHQLRLHTLLLGHPIVGDYTYTGDTTAPRMMLHAHTLRLPHCSDLVQHGRQGIEVSADGGKGLSAHVFGDAFHSSQRPISGLISEDPGRARRAGLCPGTPRSTSM
jgi:23S rRNA-/tRNA-specific pseudouridylate synthase